MTVHGDRPPSGAAGGAAESARVTALFDAHRAIRARWAVTLASYADGTFPDPDSVAYYRILLSSRDGTADLTAGSVDPDPPLFASADGSERWRLLSVRQLARGHDVVLDFGAPPSARQARAQGALALQTTFVAVAGVSVAGERLTNLTVRAPNAADTGFESRSVAATALRTLNAAAPGEAPDNGNSIDLGAMGSTSRLFAGRTAGGGLLLAGLVAGAPSIGITADDGPPVAAAPALPAGVDFRVNLASGPLLLRQSEARQTYTPRAVAGGRTAESRRTLRWSGIPADTLAVGAVTLDVLDPGLDRARVLPPVTAADAGRILRATATGYELVTPAQGVGLHVGNAAPQAPADGTLWVDTRDSDYPELRTWSGGSWDAVDDHEVHAGPTLPRTPNIGNSWLLTATDGAHAPGWYVCTTSGTWTRVGETPSQSQQVGAVRAPRLVTLWRYAAAQPADPYAGLAAGAYGDGGWIARPAGWALTPTGAGARGAGESLWAATAYATWDAAATPEPRWTFGGAGVAIADAYSVQYSTDSDGRAAHAVPEAADEWYRRRDPVSGAWSAWRRIHAEPDPHDWTALIDGRSTYYATNYPGDAIALPAPVRLAGLREMMIECRIEERIGAVGERWRMSRQLGPYYDVAAHADSSATFRAGISFQTDWDRNGEAKMTSGSIHLPTLDGNASDGNRWGHYMQFRRGAADPAGTASYLDVLATVVRQSRGRWWLRVR